MTPSQPNTPIKTYTALAAAVLFWGLSFVFTKMALETLPTFTLVFARFSLASIFFLALMYRWGFPKFTPKDHFKLFLTALFEPGLYFVFETIGLQHTTAPKASLIIATIPLVVMICSFILLKERPRTTGVIGIAISLLGISVLVMGDPDFSWSFAGSLFGDLMIFGAVISGALYMVIARDLGQTHSALSITTIQIFYGAIFFAPAFLWEVGDIRWAAISSRSVAALIFLTVFATVAAFLCYNYALTKVIASRASIFINCIPVVTAIGAWIILGETLTRIQLFGGAMVLIAVFVANLPASRPKPAPIEQQQQPATA